MNRKGFTLVEMMVSIGIIVILSSVVTVSAKSYLDKTKAVGSQVESHLNNYDAAKSSVDALGRGIAATGAVSLTPTPIPTPVTPIPTPVTPIPTPVTPIPTPVTPIPTPVTPIPTPTTTALPNTGAVLTDISTWNESRGNWRVKFSGTAITNTSFPKYVTVSFPSGTILTYDFNADIISTTATTAVIKLVYSDYSIFAKYANSSGTPFNVTVTALQPIYSISFDVNSSPSYNENTGIPSTPLITGPDGTITLPTTIPTSKKNNNDVKTFVGWSTSRSGGTIYSPGATITVTSQLFAIWR